MAVYKKIKKIFIWISGIFAVLIIAVSVSLYLYKDRIINHVISEANHYINTPIDVDHIGLNVWDKFPNVSLTFTNISVQESWSRSKDPLLQAEQFYVLLNPIDLALGNLEVSQVHITNAHFFIKINREGIPNYNILKSNPDSSTSESLKINLKKIILKNVALTYLDFRSNQEHQYFTSGQISTIDLSENIYNISSKGNVDIQSIKIEGKEYVHDKHISNSARFTIDTKSDLLTINPSEIGLNDSKFTTQGLIALKNPKSITMKIEGVDTNIKTLLTLLPSPSKQLLAYKSVGDIYFSLDLQGTIGKTISSNAEFGMRNTKITHPESGIRFENINMTGRLTIPDITHPESLSLDLEKVSGTISDQEFNGKLAYRDMSNPYINFDMRGAILMEDLVKLVGQDKLVRGTGLISGNVSFKGNISDIKSLHTIDRVNAIGILKLDEVEMEFLHNYPPKTTITGDVSYKENDLNVNQALIRMGSSAWQMSGSFKNLLPYLVSPGQDLRIEANIIRGNLVLDEFLKPSDRPSEFKFAISENLNVDVTARLDRLTFDRFSASQIQGSVKINNQMAFIKDLKFHSMGGNLNFNSLINTHENLIRINNSTHFEGINIDSVFYVYKNFNQEWLKSDNLKGRIDADILTDMVFSQNLEFFADSLIADISIAIIGGELNDFEPMRKLEKFVDDEDLSRLRFSELKNDIHIEDKIIYIPNMEVQSNVSNLLISGTHTFDQRIEYHVVVPFKTLKNRNEDMFGAIEDDGTGSKLHLIIAGTTQDYSIEYDTKAVGKKIISDLKKEVKELKNAFKKKEQKTEEITLNEDDYFEWDEDTTSYHFQY